MMRGALDPSADRSVWASPSSKPSPGGRSDEEEEVAGATCSRAERGAHEHAADEPQGAQEETAAEPHRAQEHEAAESQASTRHATAEKKGTQEHEQNRSNKLFNFSGS